MQGNFPSKAVSRAYSFAVILLLFVASECILNAQTFYANLGPASFSRNWGASQNNSQYERQQIFLRSYRYHPSTASAASTAPVRQETYVGVDDSETAPNPPETAPPRLAVNSATQPTVPGRRAVLRHGVAYAPAEAPLAVKRAIWAINTIHTKPYVWGGGHDSFFDPRGYDCSGTVSFALHYAGQLGSPTDSRSLMNFGAPGPGHWMTIYARDGHTWMVIAGLRLDTTGYYGNEGPRWRNDYRSPWGFTERHPVGL